MGKLDIIATLAFFAFGATGYFDSQIAWYICAISLFVLLFVLYLSKSSKNLSLSEDFYKVFLALVGIFFGLAWGFYVSCFSYIRGADHSRLIGFFFGISCVAIGFLFCYLFKKENNSTEMKPYVLTSISSGLLLLLHLVKVYKVNSVFQHQIHDWVLAILIAIPAIEFLYKINYKDIAFGLVYCVKGLGKCIKSLGSRIKHLATFYKLFIYKEKFINDDYHLAPSILKYETISVVLFLAIIMAVELLIGLHVFKVAELLNILPALYIIAAIALIIYMIFPKIALNKSDQKVILLYVIYPKGRAIFDILINIILLTFIIKPSLIHLPKAIISSLSPGHFWLIVLAACHLMMITMMLFMSDKKEPFINRAMFKIFVSALSFDLFLLQFLSIKKIDVFSKVINHKAILIINFVVAFVIMFSTIYSYKPLSNSLLPSSDEASPGSNGPLSDDEVVLRRVFIRGGNEKK